MSQPNPNDAPPAAPGGQSLAEFSFRAALVGAIIGILFGAANAYLGLRVGITVSASIPAAVMSIAVFRALSRMRISAPATILENNIVQTIGSSGEAMAAGIIYTMPALILLGQSPNVLKIFVLGAIGGTLGVLFMVPLRRYLIVREHGKLTYPEGTACAGVLIAGQKGGEMGRMVFAGLGLGAVYEFFASGMGLWKTTPAWRLPRYDAAEISAEASPALLGVGYIIGPRIAAVMFAGGALAWLVFIPAIKLFGAGSPTMFPATVPIADLDPTGIWKSYVRYIGAGAVVFGGFVTMIRSLPVIFSSARAMLPTRGTAHELKEKWSAIAAHDRDLPGSALLIGITICLVAMIALPKNLVPGEILTSILATVFAFFFVAVSARVVGLVGSSSNPISGMTIAALLATTLIFKLLGWTDGGHQAAALAVGAIVCLAAANAGDTSQDLKTGFLVGATPWKMQLGELVGVLSAAAVIGLIVLRLDKAYTLGSPILPAPQATLMTMVVKGVLAGDLPWSLVLIGVATAAIVELLGIPSLPFAVGLYLPFSMSSPIMIGGIVRYLADRKLNAKNANHEDDGAQAITIGAQTITDGAQAITIGAQAITPANQPECPDDLTTQRGVLFASGLIAGSAFIGMALGLIRSIGADPAWTACRASSSLLACSLSHPPAALYSAFQSISLGPAWAASYQDFFAGAIILAAAIVIYLISRKRLAVE
jgi:putative OPT family oligopeptide transporter